MPTALSPARLRGRPAKSGAPRSSFGRTRKWWAAPQASASETSASFTSSTCP